MSKNINYLIKLYQCNLSLKEFFETFYQMERTTGVVVLIPIMFRFVGEGIYPICKIGLSASVFFTGTNPSGTNDSDGTYGKTSTIVLTAIAETT